MNNMPEESANTCINVMCEKRRNRWRQKATAHVNVAFYRVKRNGYCSYPDILALFHPQACTYTHPNQQDGVVQTCCLIDVRELVFCEENTSLRYCGEKSIQFNLIPLGCALLRALTSIYCRASDTVIAAMRKVFTRILAESKLDAPGAYFHAIITLLVSRTELWNSPMINGMLLNTMQHVYKSFSKYTIEQLSHNERFLDDFARGLKIVNQAFMTRSLLWMECTLAFASEKLLLHILFNPWTGDLLIPWLRASKLLETGDFGAYHLEQRKPSVQYYYTTKITCINVYTTQRAEVFPELHRILDDVTGIIPDLANIILDYTFTKLSINGRSPF